MFVCEVCGERSEHAKFCTRDGSALVGTDDPFLGAEVGRYRLTRLLGRGGMGRVYAGVQPELGSRVAIKVLSDEASERPELVERFFNEARAVNMIHHEGIVNVIDLMRLPSGRPVIVMELVDGRTLREIVRAGPVPLGGIVQVMIEVLQALAAAHAIGIVHRDLKPDNILVTNAGRAKVLDFGVAKLSTNLQGDAHPTKTGAILGTPHYMSPEQIGGGTVDARADVYAAGIVLYEAVTGHLPFEGLGAFDLMRAHLEQMPPSPRELRPDLPRGIEQVILCALAKQRGERFTTANAMANALHEAASQLSAEQWRALTTDGRMFPRSFTPPAPIERQMTAPTGPMPGSQPTPLTRRDRPIAQASNHELAPVLEPTPMPPPRRSRVGIFAAIAAAILGAGIAAIVMSVRDRPAPTTGDPNPATTSTADASLFPVVVATVAGDAGTVVNMTLPDGGTTPLRAMPGLPVPMANMDIIQMSMPPDLQHFDPTAFIATAQQLAAKLVPDPQLVMMHFGPLFHDGHVDLTIDIDNKTRIWLFQPRTPEATKRADGKMLCTVSVAFPQVDYAPQVIVVSGLREISCTRKMPLVARRCTPIEAWDRLVGSTKWNTHGTVVTWTTASMSRGSGGWIFDGEKTGETGRMVTGVDDCGVAPSHPATPGTTTVPGAHPMPKGDGFYLDFPIDDHFDGVAYAPTALALAKKIRPDVHLIEMRLAPINSTGFARFAGFPGIDPDFTYIFYSPTAAKEPAHDERRDDGLLLHLRGCEVFVQIEPRQKIVTVKTSDSTTCKDNPEHMPRCTLQQLWAKGLAKGIKADVPAWTHYEYNRWGFSGEKGDDRQHFEFPDDCSGAAATPAKADDPFKD